MTEIPERDAARLLDMLLAACDILEFAGGLTKEQFLSSQLHQNAIIRSLEVIGKAAGHVPPDTTAALPTIPWQAITGMRQLMLALDRWRVFWKKLDQVGFPVVISVNHTEVSLIEARLNQ